MSVKFETIYSPIGFYSYFSLLKGLLSPEDICRHLALAGYRTAGMADINNFYGLVRFLKACKAAGLHAVVGVRVEQKNEVLFTAYITGPKGFAMANRIITRLLTVPHYDPVEELTRNGWEDLVIVTGKQNIASRLLPIAADLGMRSDIGAWNKNPERAGLFFEVTYGKAFAASVKFAKSKGLPLVAINSVRYVIPSDRKIYNLVRAIDLNCRVEELPARELGVESYRWVSAEEMVSFFSAIPQAIKNTQVIAERCTTEGIIHDNYVFPAFDGLTEEEAYKRLKGLCFKRIDFRYPFTKEKKKEREAVLKRLNYELSIIREKGFAGYFLVVHDIVSRYPRTCGRGSSASSIVSYLLGITHVDPIRYNLFFERFLNRGRKDPPDIDVDFPWDERMKTLRYVFGKYSGRVGMVADHVTFGRRSSIREPARALGFPEEEIKKIVTLIRKGNRERIPRYLLGISDRIKGFPHYIGTHPGGVVITPSAITNYTHIQNSPLGYPVIAWDKDATEDAGLVKIDLLGNRSLGVLRDAIEMINSGRAVEIEWAGFNPLGNEKVSVLIARGDTIGIFYIESPATRQLLKKMRVGDFENLVIASSIIRPAANRYVTAFVRRLRGERYRPVHPLVEETLKETYGIMVYQEDVSRIAIDLAGFSPEEADMLRKVVSKKNRAGKLASYRKLFFEKGMARGVSREVLNSLWDMILSFEGYSFCKAHSASYAMVSYKLAYIKRFHPLEFIVAVINNGGGFYTRQTYIDECRRMGFRILPPDVNKSGVLYGIESNIESNTEICPEVTPCKQRCMRVGLSQLKKVNRSFITRLIEERTRNGNFKSLEDFILRVKPGLPEMRVLIKSGALDNLARGCTRPEIFWKYYHALHFDKCFISPEIPNDIGDYTEMERLAHQYESLGVIIDRYPVEIFEERIAETVKAKGLYPFIPSKEISRYSGKTVTTAGMLVTGKEVLTKNRERMLFLSFEDRYSVYEAVLFPAAFKRLYKLLEPDGVYLVTGRVEEELGAANINIENLLLVGTLSSAEGGVIEQRVIAVV